MAMGISAVLAAVVAGAGLKMSNDTKSQQLTVRAADIARAVDNWLMTGNVMRGPKDTIQGCCGAAEFQQLAKYMPDNSVMVTDPWTNTSNWPYSFFSTANDTYANADAFSSAAYPFDGVAPRLDLRGKILILTKGSPTYSTFRVWDNTANYKSFQFYAIQAIDNRGYPIVTYGR